MNKLKLYKRSDWFLQWAKTNNTALYELEKDKIYTCLGEFSHAPGHVLMCEFGAWRLTGMDDINNFEEVDRHPADITFIDEFLDDDDAVSYQ
jgi:hypothetical protein